jgi:hypothetical protein
MLREAGFVLRETGINSSDIIASPRREGAFASGGGLTYSYNIYACGEERRILRGRQ